MNNYLLPLEKQFKKHADKTKAEGARAYLLNQFDFYGIPMAQRRQLCKDFIKANPLLSVAEVEKTVKQAWQLPEREWQYFAIELLVQYKKQWKVSTMKLIEYCITHKSWWDTVDHIASEWTGPYFKLFPGQVKAVTNRWNRSRNIWLQRSSLLFQKQYKLQTDTKLLTKYILHCAGSNEFFLQKAIGWALREYGKANPDWDKAFVSQHTLRPLSSREALKNL